MDQSLRTLIEQAEFKESFRGYDRAQVDDTLEELATRAGKLETDAAEATRRLADAETRIRAEVQAELGGGAAATTGTKTGPPGRTEQEAAEEVRLTLVMAQRTADAAIAEARVKAEELLDAARTEAMRTTADARAESTKERQDGRKRLASEIKELEDIRKVLQGDIEVMELHVSSERKQLSTSIDRLRALLDDPEALRTRPAPTPTPVTIPDPPEDPAASPTSTGPAEGAKAAPGAPASGKDSKSPAGVGGGDGQVDHPEPGVAGVPGAAQTGANGEGKAEVPSVDASHEEDAFLSELRKAMSDDEPLGPGAGPVAGQAAESPTLQSSAQAASAADQDKPRFGRRR